MKAESPTPRQSEAFKVRSAGHLRSHSQDNPELQQPEINNSKLLNKAEASLQ